MAVVALKPRCGGLRRGVEGAVKTVPYGLGLAHQLYWPVFFKKQGLGFWLRALEKFGAPTGMGVYPAGSDKATQEKLLRAIHRMTMRDFSVESSDNVVFTDVPHQENIELLGERTLTAKFKAGTPDIATFNPETKWRTNDVLVSTLVHNVGSPGNIVTVNSRGQLGVPNHSRDKGQDMIEASVGLVGSDLGTDDDMAIILT